MTLSDVPLEFQTFVEFKDAIEKCEFPQLTPPVTLEQKLAAIEEFLQRPFFANA